MKQENAVSRSAGHSGAGPLHAVVAGRIDAATDSKGFTAVARSRWRADLAEIGIIADLSRLELLLLTVILDCRCNQEGESWESPEQLAAMCGVAQVRTIESTITRLARRHLLVRKPTSRRPHQVIIRIDLGHLRSPLFAAVASPHEDTHNHQHDGHHHHRAASPESSRPGIGPVNSPGIGPVNCAPPRAECAPPRTISAPPRAKTAPPRARKEETVTNREIETDKKPNPQTPTRKPAPPLRPEPVGMRVGGGVSAGGGWRQPAITETDLRDPGRVLAIVIARGWCARGIIEQSERVRLHVLATAARAVRLGNNPGAMFCTLVQRGLRSDDAWVLDQADEDQAMLMERSLQGRTPKRRTPTHTQILQEAIEG